jgi:hypothetical protein
MEDYNEQPSLCPDRKPKTPHCIPDQNRKDEIRYWQTVSLTLAMFALSLIVSLLISVLIMLLTR